MAALGLGFAAAQVEDTPPGAGAACGTPSYVLIVDDEPRKAPMRASLNGRPVPSQTTSVTRTNVTSRLAQDNRLQLDWAVNDTLSGRPWPSTVKLQLVNGNRVTDMLSFDARYYPNRRTLAYRFSRPPANSAACSSSQYLLYMQGRTNRVVEWTVSVDGKFYVYHLARGYEKVDLRPFLTKGQNRVTLGWRVISANGRGELKDAAFITSDASGTTQRLLTAEPRAITGNAGSKTVTITVR